MRFSSLWYLTVQFYGQSFSQSLLMILLNQYLMGSCICLLTIQQRSTLLARTSMIYEIHTLQSILDPSVGRSVGRGGVEVMFQVVV